jgi:dihydroorotate dehydrogenase (NAD+) catalytic subunit
MSKAGVPDLSTDLGGIQLRNPVLTASGTFGYGTELAPFMDLRRIGGFVAKSLTLEPRYGNPPPRIVETPAGMLNAISLENVGVDAFVEEKLPEIPEGVPVIASVFGTEVELYSPREEWGDRVRPEPRGAGPVDSRGAARDLPSPAREALAQRDGHRRDGPGL